MEEFTLKFLSRERRQVQRKDGFLEFLTPEALLEGGMADRYKAVTFDRSSAIQNPQAEFFAIGHPFVDGMLRYIGNYDFGGHTAIRVFKIQNSEEKEPVTGFQFNFTVRRRVAREDGDEYFFDLHTVFVNSNGKINEKLAEIALKGYSLEIDELSAPVSAALGKLDSTLLGKAFESAKSYLQEQTKLWDWDEEVDLIGIAKVAFLTSGS
jgi:hypothetical protein